MKGIELREMPAGNQQTSDTRFEKGIKSNASATPGLIRIPELDGLRGIAILLVITFHYLNNQLLHTGNSFGRLLGAVTSFGWVGVDLFFVLSGFLIGTILLANKGSKNFFSTFYFRRLVRIIPNYYLLLFLFIGMTSIPFFSKTYFLAGNNVIPLWSYFLMCHNLFMGTLNNMGNKSLSITWSIGIEEQFYVVIPFIVYYLRERLLPLLLMVLILCAPLIRLQYTEWKPAYVFPFCRMDALAFGVLIAYYHQKIDLAALVKKYINWVYTILAVTIIVCGVLYGAFGDLGTIKHSLFSILFSGAVILALTMKHTRYAALLRSKWLMKVGVISYSLYLFNYLILGLFHYLITGKDGVSIESPIDIMVTLLAFITTFAVSWLVYNKLELPMVRLGKKLKY